MTRAAALVGWPWDWQGPTPHTEDGDTFYELRITELPDFFVAGRTEDEVLAEAADALEAFLASYLERGESVPDPRRQLVVSTTKPAGTAHLALAFGAPA